MAKPKIYATGSLEPRISSSLHALLQAHKTHSWRRTGVDVLVLAASKDQAVEVLDKRGLCTLLASDLRVADLGISSNGAVAAAGLLDGGHDVLAIDEQAARVVAVPEGEPASCIGRLQFRDGRMVFFPDLARYAAEGSLAVGRFQAWMKTGQPPRPWVGTDGDASDKWIDERAAAGELQIARAGYDTWREGLR